MNSVKEKSCTVPETILPQQKELEFPKVWGLFKTKTFKEMYEI